MKSICSRRDSSRRTPRAHRDAMRISSTVIDEDVDEEEDVLTKPGGLSASSLRTSVRSCTALARRYALGSRARRVCSPLAGGTARIGLDTLSERF